MQQRTINFIIPASDRTGLQQKASEVGVRLSDLARVAIRDVLKKSADEIRRDLYLK